MSAYRNRRIATGLLLAAIIAGAGIWVGTRSGTPPGDPEPDPLLQTGMRPPPQSAAAANRAAELTLSTSRYLNTHRQAEYVGSAACVECHRDQHASFASTPHNHALADLTLSEEPPDVEFRHEKSGRVFQVYRKNGEMRHRETLWDPGKEELVLGDYPVASRIGSGHHSRSYLIEIDGFLVESPVTWYTSRQKWALSPGYDIPRHPSFTRPAHQGCVHCHAGRVHSVGGSTHRLRFEEQKIGCESCHGPGSLHVKRRRAAEPVEGDDLTIVNPSRLSRKLNEAICARCHLRGAALTHVRGRRQNDYRPGLPLTDFRIDYRAGASAESMSVVGHFEQLYESRCYTQSSAMTCTTCHNPHASPARTEKAAYYRRKCQACHEDGKGCGLDEKTRLRKSPQNDCASCHMPKAETDIPHFAFTHHRIGLNQSLDYRKKKKNKSPVRLVEMGDVSQLPLLERQRCLGLAYLQYAKSTEDDFAEVYQQRALELLDRVYQAGVRDATVLAALARLLWDRKRKECIGFAEAALKADDCTPATRVNALIVLGDMNLQLDRIGSAESAFRRLTELRRAAVDWRMLGVCRSLSGNVSGAVAALRRAISIRPDDPELRRMLAGELKRDGKPAEASKHRRIAERLEKRMVLPAKPPP